MPASTEAAVAPQLERTPPKWIPVRRKSARQNKSLGRFPIATRSGTALGKEPLRIEWGCSMQTRWIGDAPSSTGLSLPAKGVDDRAEPDGRVQAGHEARPRRVREQHAALHPPRPDLHLASVAPICALDRRAWAIRFYPRLKFRRPCLRPSRARRSLCKVVAAIAACPMATLI